MKPHRLDPYNHLIRSIKSLKNLDELDKRHIITSALRFKRQTELSLDRQINICSGLFSYAQSIRMRPLLDQAKPSDRDYRGLTWAYSRHIENWNKTRGVIGKGEGPKGRKSRKDAGSRTSAMWASPKKTETEPTPDAGTG